MAFFLQNFMAASRKPNLQPFGLMAANQDLSWIAANNFALSLATLAGTQNGNNNVFTLSVTPASGTVVFWNGIALAAGTGYTVSGATVTFQPAYLPQAGDTLRALVW